MPSRAPIRSQLTVTDDSTTDTARSSDTLSVRVNEPPVAEAGPDQLVTASLVEFDGSASGDHDDSIANYDWDFGDGGTGSGAEADATSTPSPAPTTVRLTVTDASKTIRSSASDDTMHRRQRRADRRCRPRSHRRAGRGLVFSAARSLDPDGEIADYRLGFPRRRRPAPARRPSTPSRSRAPTSPPEGQGQYRAGCRRRLRRGRGLRQPAAGRRRRARRRRGAGTRVDLSAANSYDTDGEIASYRWDFSDSDEPVEGANTVAGAGSASAVLAGTKLTITGTFEGLRSPATAARLHNGLARGVRGAVRGRSHRVQGDERHALPARSI